METKSEIYSQLVELLEDLFEVDPSTVSSESRLYEDLDIDSIDAVDMMVRLKQLIGKKVDPQEFKNVRTVGDVTNAIYDLLNKSDDSVE